MPLIADELTIWDISFRWAGYDPSRLWFRLPLTVKDYARLLMHAILHGEIVCVNLTLAKRPPESKADPRFYIRTYVGDVYDCIFGKRFNRKLLRWATLDRMDFHEWCERRGIPLPEFWFPSGWKLDFEMPELGARALCATHLEPEDEGGFSLRYDYPEIVEEGDNKNKEKNAKETDDSLSLAITSKDSENNRKLRANQKAKIACQQIAGKIWVDDLHRTIPSIVEDELIQKYGGGKHYDSETVYEWIREIAPPEVKNRRGRPRKNRDKES
ncbi:hypothetical protein [Nitrosomonas sp. Nm132]|uniref:hypothetical protein n=1 Tax=Nitrosomonas sp. Nm132 TaxID=1881053 RepID=UPI00087F0BDE|nr:hypothetical protein [Nitrosomonas sp. Nm132]SDH96940.1 hypothetical protein SAMN05428952_10517 [Nitrosomonas sp. Nm132]